MPSRDIPGVEEGQGSRNIEGVATSIAGFVGLAKDGPVREAVLITNFDEFKEKFGDYWASGQLAYSVAGFFENGGHRCYIVRVNEADEEITNKHYIVGLRALDKIDDVSIIAIPDAGGIVAVIKAGIAYCEKRKYCFFIADAPMEKETTDIISFIKDNTINSSYAAIYYPNIYVKDPLTDDQKLIYPSGHIAGCYAKTDSERGVWKAPAGRERKLIGAVELEQDITQEDQGSLNPIGVNVIRKFEEVGIVVWGGRTLAPESEWKYVNVRRFINYVEHSVSRGTQWVIFEPNDEPLWAQLRMTINAFLEELFRLGALQGARPQEAYFVKCDSENNTHPEEGKVNIEIGLAVLRPAEFLITKITQRAGK